MSVWLRTSVSLKPFQERFRQMQAAPPSSPHGRPPRDAATRIAARLEWRTPVGTLDSPRVRRTLGLRPEPGTIRQTKKGPKFHPAHMRESVTLDMALRLCDAMDLDPVDLGI